MSQERVKKRPSPLPTDSPKHHTSCPRGRQGRFSLTSALWFANVMAVPHMSMAVLTKDTSLSLVLKLFLLVTVLLSEMPWTPFLFSLPLPHPHSRPFFFNIELQNEFLPRNYITYSGWFYRHTSSAASQVTLTSSGLACNGNKYILIQLNVY